MGELVSVIVPVYNTEKYIERCIRSILNQTYTEIELVLVDDGSEQKEEAIIKKYMEQDERVSYIKNNGNQGLFRTRVNGVKHSTGGYIIFVDSDDYINLDFIRLLVKKAGEERADITFAKTVLDTPKGEKAINIFQEVSLSVLPLSGERVRREFFGQRGFACVWHTIWNKLYTRELWEKCLPYFEKMDRHIVMAEDIAFSCILFYFAEKAARVENSIYYDCQYKEAPTSTSHMSYAAYKKNVSDIGGVFQFLGEFFEDKEAWIKDDLLKFKQHYARIWKRGAANVEGGGRQAEALVHNFCQDLGDGEIAEDGYFGMAQAPYSDRLDEIKNRIWRSDKEYVSFDVFDTVVTRPFFHPTDLFYFLDKIYEKEWESNLSFYTIRMEGEGGCRQKLCSQEKEDVTIHEIYAYISETYGIPRKICEKIKEEECSLEVAFSQDRKAVHEIYDLALLAGKKVIFISDMYLDKRTMSKILEGKGYGGYEQIFVSSEYGKLKATGHLFEQAANAMHIDLKDMVHLGDNLVADVKMPSELGMEAIYIPKATDVFQGKVDGRKVNRCFGIGKEASGTYRGQKAFENINGYGCMAAMAANKYFDNPFRPFHPMSDFNMDASFIGYYVLGMNLAAQIQWLERLRGNKVFQRIIFTSRDGYLLKRAYDSYLKISGRDREVQIQYRHTSRKSMLPAMLKSKADFMALPIVYQNYTPNRVLELLEFCVADMPGQEWEKICGDNGFLLNKRFRSVSECHRFMNLFLKMRYGRKKHEGSRRQVEEYWGDIKDTDAIYDMGYGASIHNAIVQATGKRPTALFVHTDKDRHLPLKRKSQFTIEPLMDSIPNISELMREYFFSDIHNGTCKGYKKENGIVRSVLETENRGYVDKFSLVMMQDAALQFVEEFYTKFSRYLPYLDIRVGDAQMPFEGFLCSPTVVDTKIFMASYCEDKACEGLANIPVRDFWLQLLAGLPGCREDILDNFEEFIQEKGKKQLAFFGTGGMCRYILNANPSIPVSVFLDNDRKKRGQNLYGRTVVLPDDVDNIKDLFIIIVCVAYMEIEDQLEKMGLVKYSDYVNYTEIF